MTFERGGYDFGLFYVLEARNIVFVAVSFFYPAVIFIFYFQ